MQAEFAFYMSLPYRGQQSIGSLEQFLCPQREYQGGGWRGFALRRLHNRAEIILPKDGVSPDDARKRKTILWVYLTI